MSSVIVAKAFVILAFKFVISGTDVENTLSLTYAHKKISRWVISGDRGGQSVGPSLPIHQFGNVSSKNRRTSELQCGAAPSCWKIIHGWNSSNWGVRNCLNQIKSFILNTIDCHKRNLDWISTELFLQEGNKCAITRLREDSENETRIGNHRLTLTSYMFLERNRGFCTGSNSVPCIDTHGLHQYRHSSENFQ